MHNTDMDVAWDPKKAETNFRTMINEALRQYLEKSDKPLNEEVIRQVIREELDRAVPH